ncbi:MAG: hypothetical protein NTV01_04060, partial [Bacteroidia bacterium]|nr:hypothetical protein [Bacteroidia bacterium]
MPLCLGSSLNLDAGPGAFYEWEDVKIKQRYRTITNDSVYPLMEYRVKVTDYHGCIGWDTLWVEKKIPPVITSVTTVRAFCGNKDGSVTVIPNGNIQNYDYKWKGYPENNSNSLTGINGGDYVVQVISKSTLCEVIDTIHVDELGGSSVKIIHSQDTICPGAQITLKLEGSSEIQWLSPPGLTGSEVTMRLDTTTVFILNATNYDEGRSCVTPVTDTVHVFPKNPPDLEKILTPCGGNPLSIDGGIKYIEWSWSDGQTGRFAQIRNDMDALILYATDTNQCVFTDTVGIHFLPGPTVNLGRDTAVCSTDPITLWGGTGDSYVWSRLENSETILLGITESIQADMTGDYILTITAAGCSLSDTIHVQLNDPNSLNVDNVIFRDVSCYGAGNGYIKVSASGDGRDFYYSINGGVDFYDNKGIFDNVQPGSGYVVQVLADSVCSTIWPEPITINQPDTLIVKFCALPPSCKECNDGKITVSQITGGTPPYMIRLDGADQDSVMLNLSLGDYLLTITDAKLCAVPIPVSLKEGTRPQIVSSINQPVCTGTPVTLRVTNSLQAEWINPPGSYNMEITVFPTGTTTYRVKSINPDADGFACESMLEYTVNVIPFNKPELGDNIKACKGDTIPLSVVGDYQSYVWSNLMTGRDIRLAETADPLIVTVMDSNFCFLKDTVSVIFYEAPPVDLGKDTSVCSKYPIT